MGGEGTFHFQEIIINFKTIIGSNLQMENLVEYQKVEIGVCENNFLIKREC